jgi:acetyl esterase/lipase
MPFQYDPAFQKAVAPSLAAKANGPKPDMSNPLSIRSIVEPGFRQSMALFPEAVDVNYEEHQIPTHDGQSIAVYRHWRKDLDTTTPQPAILQFHGGGLIMGRAKVFKRAQDLLAQKSGVQIFSVDYRLAPEHPYPTPAEDGYSALVWLQEHAAQFSVDPKRIITVGESAGGNLVASINLMARDRGLSPPIAKQMLVYPMLDDRSTTAVPEMEGLLIWKPEANITAWSAYLGDDYGTDRVSQYAAPARALTVKGLPSTYLEIGTLDMFLEENLTYISRIAKENIETELHVYPSIPHGYDVFAPLSEAAERAMADRLRAISSV